MPLRALLLLPSGEQPTVLKPKPSNLRIPKTTTSTLKDALTSPFTKSVFSSLPSSPNPTRTDTLGDRSGGGQSATATGADDDNADIEGLAFYKNDLGWPFEYVFGFFNFIIFRRIPANLAILTALCCAYANVHTALTRLSLFLRHQINHQRPSRSYSTKTITTEAPTKPIRPL
jgi:hypothetical protein